MFPCMLGGLGFRVFPQFDGVALISILKVQLSMSWLQLTLREGSEYDLDPTWIQLSMVRLYIDEH